MTRERRTKEKLESEKTGEETQTKRGRPANNAGRSQCDAGEAMNCEGTHYDRRPNVQQGNQVIKGAHSFMTVKYS